MGDKQVNTLPVKEFKYGVDHFDSWIQLFEKAIKLAYKGAAADDIADASEQWLPLKLDDQARLVYDGVTGADWAAIKANLKKALVDPQEEYLWHARRATIVWDGVESFQSLGTRITRAVDTHHKGEKESEYFFRFRLALPRDYQRAIDLGCAKGDRTIKNAIDIAERVRVADSDVGEAGATATPQAAPKTVTFTGASMTDDRLKSLELAVQGLSIRMENQETAKKAEDEPRSRRDESRKEFFDNRDRRSSSRDSRYDRRDSYERRRRDDSRDSRRSRHDSRDRYRAYDNSPYRGRSRRDSFDRRDAYTRSYQDQDYDRRDSYNRRDSYDRRDRYRSPSYARGSRYNRSGSGRDSDDRGRSDGWRRRDSRDRGYGRSRQDTNRRWDSRSPKKEDRPDHRLAEFNDVDWLCAAISEKRDRDRETQEN